MNPLKASWDSLQEAFYTKKREDNKCERDRKCIARKDIDY